MPVKKGKKRDPSIHLTSHATEQRVLGKEKDQKSAIYSSGAGGGKKRRKKGNESKAIARWFHIRGFRE